MEFIDIRSGEYYSIDIDDKLFYVIQKGRAVLAVGLDDYDDYDPNPNGGWESFIEFRRSTVKEIEWLEACKEVGKYVDNPKLKQGISMKYEDIKKGEYYTTHNAERPDEVGCICKHSFGVVLVTNKEFESSDSSSWAEFVKFKAATDEEKSWYDACEREGKYVEKPVQMDISFNGVSLGQGAVTFNPAGFTPAGGHDPWANWVPPSGATSWAGDSDMRTDATKYKLNDYGLNETNLPESNNWGDQGIWTPEMLQILPHEPNKDELIADLEARVAELTRQTVNQTETIRDLVEDVKDQNEVSVSKKFLEVQHEKEIKEKDKEIAELKRRHRDKENWIGQLEETIDDQRRGMSGLDKEVAELQNKSWKKRLFG